MYLHDVVYLMVTVMLYMQTINHAIVLQTAFDSRSFQVTHMAGWRCVQAMSGELFVVMELLLLLLQQ